MNGIAGQGLTVLGAGIGGLAVAIALADRGAKVTVIEQAPALEQIGAGIQVSPNGWAVLRALGLGHLAAQALRSQAVTLLDGPSGRPILRMDLAGKPYHLFHRATLIAGLARVAAERGVKIVLGWRIDRLRRSAGGWRLEGPGDPLETTFIIGADGLHSRLRTALNGADLPFFTGQVAWRALIDAKGAGEAASLPGARVWMGPGRHLVAYPLRGGAINLVGVEERGSWAEEGWSHEGDPSAFAAAFDGFAPAPRALVSNVRDVHVWGLHRHRVARRWHGDGAALLGDAAHPTLPFLAQGANLALEDAWTLAAALDELGFERGPPAYQDARYARTVRAIEAADGNARNYHLRNPLLRRGAHLALRMGNRVLPGGMLARFDWLYGHDVTRAAIRPSRAPR
ncbi:FAD-dependent monooxygenase [Profundibacterium mesophilum]|uniref:Salicylate hydroxylase n=1 Tax=Profundibacterium mesophilum KAUST100406-0324 TaxID=1037889 RepID=A0A921NYD7_9RHOB|nr:FAD-dependent monooxygenase [Profundibacterium mesophilum]KAF0677636.1 putative salicylate hydroxylase [Profundibacterium mesophilum KAUST100406-0324]